MSIFFDAFLGGIALLLGGDARPIRVPEALRARTCNPEPSAIVWCAPLDRYLVVSDDTGRRELGTYHAPFVLAMSEAGVLDDEPVPIVGIDRLNDPEAASPGPDGTLFLATSHSRNRRGKTKRERRQLLH